MAKKSLVKSARVKRGAISVISLKAPSGDVAYGRSQSVNGRLGAMELLRQINYGEAARGRIKRVLEVARLEKG
jgi:hypothetical protein